MVSPRRLAHPRRRGRAGRRAWASRSPAPTAAPSTRRSPAAGTPTPVDKRIHTDGRPLPFVEVRTVDEDGCDTVPVGVPGEILTRGPDRFAGYTDPALTAASVDAEGWFRTGDVGVARRRGFPDRHRPGEGHHHPGRRERQRRRGRAAAGQHGRGGRGGGGRRARRAARRARVRLLPDAGRASPRPRSMRCARTLRPPAWPGRSGPRRSGWPRNCPAPLRARSRSSSCESSCGPADEESRSLDGVSRPSSSVCRRLNGRHRSRGTAVAGRAGPVRAGLVRAGLVRTTVAGVSPPRRPRPGPPTRGHCSAGWSGPGRDTSRPTTRLPR